MRRKNPIAEIRECINHLENYADELAKEHNVEHLGGPQGLTVMYLWKHQDEEVFIKDIERFLSISKSVASSLIKRMERNGFIEVIPSEKDKRFKQVVLTELSLEKARKMHAFHEAIQKKVLAGISKEDLAVAQAVFMKIKENLEKE